MEILGIDVETAVGLSVFVPCIVLLAAHLIRVATGKDPVR